MVAISLGGLGLFLIGMILITDSLKTLAGDMLRKVLLRYTGGRFKALLSGAGVTAIIQSSSATTVATIGFVGAGLITFQQAIGIVYGANLGTTATGWIVALFGLKFDVTVVALPLIGVGALMRLFARGRGSHVGLALAGFGIIFLGIDVLQEGMAGVAERVRPESFPEDTWTGRLALLGIGFLLTAIVQSSSAAMVTALAALHTGAVSLEQAAAIVIGINVGTTATASIAVIGGTVAAKRTAVAHVLFNVVTGGVAFLLLPVFVLVAHEVGETIGPGDATLVIAAFHTVFNLLGIALIYPFTARFTRFIERVIRDRGPRLTRFLDLSAGAARDVAVEAARHTLFEISAATGRALLELLTVGRLSKRSIHDLEAAEEAVQEVHRYLSDVSRREIAGADHDRALSTLRALEYVDRLVDLTIHEHAAVLATTPEYRTEVANLVEKLRLILEWLGDETVPPPTETIHATAERIAEFRHEQRRTIFERAASGAAGTAESIRATDGLRWIEDTSHALWRVTEHLRDDRVHLGPRPEESPPAGPAPEVPVPGGPTPEGAAPEESASSGPAPVEPGPGIDENTSRAVD